MFSLGWTEFGYAEPSERRYIWLYDKSIQTKEDAVTRPPPLNFNSTAPNRHEKPPSPPASLPSPQTGGGGKYLLSGSQPKPLEQRQPDQSSTRTADMMERHPMDSGEGILLDHDCLVLDGMGFGMPDICYDIGMFGEDHEATMDVNLIAWQSSDSALPNTFIEAERVPETDTEKHVRTPAKSYKELLKLSLELIEDQELLDTQAPLTSKHKPATGTICSNSQQHNPINRMLNHTTRFWDLLKRISSSTNAPQPQCFSNESTATGSSSTSSHSNHRRNWSWTAGTSHGSRDSSSLSASHVSVPRQDHLLIVNLVTTYVYLVRSCQGVFTRLYNALDITPIADFSSMLNLPSLQFGEFQLHNNPAIQVKVLIELISSMLLRIEECLGISQVTAGKRSSMIENQDYRLSILNDPLAVSIREIILSQERLQGGIHSGELAFTDLMTNLKQLLERK